MSNEPNDGTPKKGSPLALFAVLIFVVALAVAGGVVGYHVRPDLAGVGIGIMAASPVGLLAGVIAAVVELPKK